MEQVEKLLNIAMFCVIVISCLLFLFFYNLEDEIMHEKYSCGYKKEKDIRKKYYRF